MKKLISVIILCILWCLPISAYEIGNNVYLNACGADPQEYYDKPLNIQNIVTEVPNRIIKLEKSKYDRKFQTLATSTTNLGNDKINISTVSLANLNVSRLKLDKLEKKRVNIVDFNNAKYIINSYMPKVRGNNIILMEKFEKFYEIKVNNHPINTVYKKK